VIEHSIAETAGLKAGDLIISVAGAPAKEAGDVISAVQRQAPGTWLPITVKRANQSLELVARFPPAQ
jgi:S1-C subfamily serine protease